MRFLIHGTITPEGQAAMTKHGHSLHTPLELSEDSASPDQLTDSPAELLPLLAKKQWEIKLLVR